MAPWLIHGAVIAGKALPDVVGGFGDELRIYEPSCFTTSFESVFCFSNEYGQLII